VRGGGFFCAALLLCVHDHALAQVVPDLSFDTAVEAPAYRTRHPRVVIDEAHCNYHTAEGRYLPFANLMRNDGYSVERGTQKFSRETLGGIDVLVIANARGADGPPHSADDAFTPEECAAVESWVSGGGRLLLIADHDPFGAAANRLAVAFGVQMGLGHVFDPARSADDPSFLSFTRGHGLHRDHPIIRGRSTRERLRNVVSFDGQSLDGPPAAVILLQLGPEAREAANAQQLQEDVGSPVAGRAQGLALLHGRGRVVVMGEAAMFSAQILPARADQPELRFGMNVPGNDDKQFALNTMRWLSGSP
jgi:hypothetical protein